MIMRNRIAQHDTKPEWPSPSAQYEFEEYWDEFCRVHNTQVPRKPMYCGTTAIAVLCLGYIQMEAEGHLEPGDAMAKIHKALAPLMGDPEPEDEYGPEEMN